MLKNLEKGDYVIKYFDKEGNPSEKPAMTMPIPEGMTAEKVVNKYIEAIGGKEKVMASSEYFKSVNQKVLKVPMITPVFKELKNGDYKVIMTFAKKARGLMVRYLLENNITTIEGLKGFNGENYRFSTALSSKTELVFTR